MRNAFGDHYPYALCPANAEVVDYCHTLVSEVIEVGAPDGIILEACGPLGVVHGGHHEKTEGADWGPVRQSLLSLCFCAGCRQRYTDAGLDMAELAARVRAGVDGGEPASVAEALGGELAAALSAVRTGVARDLRQLLVGRVRELAPDTRVVVHANADEWATGPFATVAPAVAADVDVLTVNCWQGPERSIPGIRALRELAGPDTRLAGYVLALPPTPADGALLADHLRQYQAEGVREFHLYHAGMASPARLAALRHAVTHLAS